MFNFVVHFRVVAYRLNCLYISCSIQPRRCSIPITTLSRYMNE
jgi:hypothetical protein